ncbi:MAG: phosphoglycerate kinase [Candidatus Paceibacterota bacterium]
MMPRSVTEMNDVRGKKVILRLDFNVPLRNGKVFDDFRIRKSMPTIELLQSRGAKIIILSHCEGKESATLKPVFEYLKERMPISFIEKYVDVTTLETVNAMKDGEVVLFENLRVYPGEKENDQDFAKSLASLADFYVNDAFSCSHREHSSIVGIPKYLPGFVGLLFQSEIEHLSKTFNPPHPFVFILGGAKFDTKIPLIKKFLKIADTVFVGGALAHNFFKELGYPIGASVVSEGVFELKEMLDSKKIVLPTDVVVKHGDEISIKLPTEVGQDDVIVDAGAETLINLAELVDSAQYVLWNGPLGNFEIGFKEGTLELAGKIADTSAESVVGGADTLAAISSMDLEKKFNFVSSGGGAMLDFLANGTLPGIEALKK